MLWTLAAVCINPNGHLFYMLPLQKQLPFRGSACRWKRARVQQIDQSETPGFITIRKPLVLPSPHGRPPPASPGELKETTWASSPGRWVGRCQYPSSVQTSPINTCSTSAQQALLDLRWETARQGSLVAIPKGGGE